MADTPRTIREHVDLRGTDADFLALLRRQVRQESRSSAQARSVLALPPGWAAYCSLEGCPHHPGLLRRWWHRLRLRRGRG